MLVAMTGLPIMFLARLLFLPFVLGGLLSTASHVFFHGRLQRLYLSDLMETAAIFFAAPAMAAAAVLLFRWRPLLGTALIAWPALESFGLATGEGSTDAIYLFYLATTSVPFTIAAVLGVLAALSRGRTPP